MASLDSGTEGLPLPVQIGLGVFFLAAIAMAFVTRNARADLEEAIRQDP